MCVIVPRRQTGKFKSTGAGCNELVQSKLRTGGSKIKMAEKVNKSYTSFHYHSRINLSPSAEKGGSIEVYDFITQYEIYFMG